MQASNAKQASKARLLKEPFNQQQLSSFCLDTVMTDELKTAKAYMDEGKFSDAESILRKSFDRNLAELGPDHRMTLTIMSRLASVYLLLGQLEKAEKLYVECLERTESSIGGISNPETLIRTRNLAACYKEMGVYEKSLPLYSRCFRQMHMGFGLEHGDTLKIVEAMADIYFNQGNHSKAEPLYSKCLERRLHNDPTSVYRSMVKLAANCHCQGQYVRAENLYGECYRDMGRNADTDYFSHDRKIRVIKGLADAYCAQGKHAEAESKYIECLNKEENKYGTDHADTLDCIHDLADFYYKKGDHKEAELLFSECLDRRRTLLGIWDDDTMASMRYLKLVYEKQGKHQEAENLYLKCLDKLKAEFGPSDAKTLKFASSLAVDYYKRKNLARAESLFSECFERRKVTNGMEHIDTLSSMINLGCVHYRKNEISKALDLLEKALKLSKQNGEISPENHVLVHNKSNIAHIYFNQGNYEKAEKYWFEVRTYLSEEQVKRVDEKLRYALQQQKKCESYLSLSKSSWLSLGKRPFSMTEPKHE